MPLTGHLWPKLACCTKPLLISRPNFGYVLLGSWSHAAWFESTWASICFDLAQHWQFTQHPSYFETKNNVMKRIFSLSKGRSQLYDFVGTTPGLLSSLGVLGGTYQQWWIILSLNTQIGMVMVFTVQFWPKFACQDKVLMTTGENVLYTWLKSCPYMA